MAGELTASTPTVAQGAAAIKVAVDLLTLAAATDFLFVIPIEGRDQQYYVFKVERAA